MNNWVAQKKGGILVYSRYKGIGRPRKEDYFTEKEHQKLEETLCSGKYGIYSGFEVCISK